jgi:rSAM/selenodomain-associated transferase 1
MENEPIAVAILAKAPVPGLAKTRLIPVLGAQGAALLQSRLIEWTAETAARARLGPVTLWAAPDARDALLQTVVDRHGFALQRQSEGDLGARMLAAVQAANDPVLVIGTDCPGLTPTLLQSAADILRRGSDVVLLPAEDGGYVLIGMRRPQPDLFNAMPWGSACVLGETRRRLVQLGLAWQEPALLWDVDLPEDLERLRARGFDAYGRGKVILL